MNWGWKSEFEELESCCAGAKRMEPARECSQAGSVERDLGACVSAVLAQGALRVSLMLSKVIALVPALPTFRSRSAAESCGMFGKL